LTPGEFLRQKEINAIRPDVGKFQYSITMTQRDNPDYIKFASNFLSEIGEFFLENKNFTALASLPQEDPNFGNAKAGRKYMMRLKMYRSVTGSKPERTSSRGPFEYPQDDSNFGETGSFFRETFTMYSNPQAFGDMALVDCPLGTNFRNTTTNPHFYNNFKDTFTYFISASHEKSGLGFNNRYEIKQWKSFQKEEHRFSYNPGVHAFNSGSGADNYLFFSGSYMSVGNDIRQGENFPYTPPYYHGEAWADFTFQADASKKYTLAEILNDTSIEFYRYYNEDLPMNADSLGSMKIARALDASKITGSSPAPRIEFFFPRQYAAIGTSIGPFASSSNIATTYKQTIIFASASLFAGTPNNNEIYINVQTSGDLPQLHATLLAKAINGTTDGDIKYGTMSGSVSGIHYFTANVDEVSGSETQVKYVSLTGSSALGGYGDHCFETYPTIGSNKDYVVYNQVGRSAFDAYTLSNHTQDSGQLFRKNFIKNYRMVNEKAMQLASSVNLLSRGVISDIEASSVNGIVNQANVNVDTEVQNSSRWIIQSKLETPMLNFNHISFDDVHTQTLHSSSATTIGMWHQYGRLPQEASEGVFIQLEAIPDTWIENVMGGDAQLTGSLLDLCGFSREPSRLGQVAESKVVSEAVVAVPFIPRGGQRKFFNLDRKDVEHAQDPGTQNLVGRTIIDQVRFMEKYVFPPSMDFIRNPSIDPFAMYIFPFEHEFSKQDLANIWQNLSPDIGLSHEVSEATISHELLFHELLGRGAIIKPGNNTEKELVKNARFKKINSRIKWLVFKVKQRASTDYFSKIFANNESGTRRERRAQRKKRRRLSNLLSRSPAQYNWPYDFFSLVELVKIDAEVDFANPDDDLTQDNRTVIRPREKVPRPSGPTKEERLARAMLGEPQRDDPTIVTENPKKPNPKGGKSKRKKTLRRKK